MQALVAGGLLGLAFEGADLASNLTEHVVHANEVLLGGLHLAFRLTPAGFVLADSGRLFDQPATVFRAGGYDLRDLPLFDDRIAAQTNPGIAEEIVDIL